MNRSFSLLVLSAVGAGMLAGVGDGESAPPPPDPQAVDAFLASLAQAAPAPSTGLARAGAAEDRKLAEAAGRLDRAEPIVGALFDVAK